MADDEKKVKADALTYSSTTLKAPKAVDHLPSPVRGGGGAGGGAKDIKEAFDAIEPHRGTWFMVAEKVGNPGRFYDGFRALGATVKVNRNGDTIALDKNGKEKSVPAFDVYAMVEEGDLKPWKKPSAKTKSEKAASEKNDEAAKAAEQRPAGAQARK